MNLLNNLMVVMSNFFGGMIALGVVLILIFLALAILVFVFWILMLVDCIKRKYKEDSEKIVWVLVLIFTGIIGALIYYFVVYNKEKSMKWFWWTLLVLIILFIFSVVGIYLGNFAV